MGESTYDGPRRRLRLVLDVGADDLAELATALHVLANDLEYEGQEERQVTSGGHGSGYHLTLTCDRLQSGLKFRHELAEWAEKRRASAPASGSNDTTGDAGAHDVTRKQAGH